MGNRKANRPDVSCRICGKKLGRVTSQHLETHGITYDEYKKLYLTPVSAFAPEAPSRGELFEQLAQWMVDDTPLGIVAQKTVDLLMERDSHRFRVALHAVAQAKMARMARYFEALDVVERRLLDPDRINAIQDDAELAQLHRILLESMRGTEDLMGRLIEPPKSQGPSVGISFNTLIDQRKAESGIGFKLPDDPRKREQLRQVIMKIDRLARQPDEPATIPVQLSPVEPPPQTPPA